MCRAILTLPCITGSWRHRSGGASFGNLEEMWLRHDLAKLHRPDLGDRASKRQISMVQVGRALSEHIGYDEEPLDPPIKSLFVYNSDPANCAPNSNGVRNGLMRDDLFVAVHETFWTDTCEYADIVLPADTQLERQDLVATYGNWYYVMNEPIIEPLGESVRNSELFRMLAKKMGYDKDTDNAFTQTDEEIIRDILVQDEVNPLMEGITFENLKKNGWWRANTESERRNFMKNGWPTPSGKIEIYSEALKDEGVDPLPTYVPEIEGQEDPKREQYPLQVLSSASHYFIGDSFQSVPRLQAMMSRPTVELSPEEADKRNLQDGDLCRLYNDRGETYAYAVIIEGMLSGMCSTQKQFKGSNTPGGVNINALNSEMLTDFGKSPTFYSCLVEVEKADEKMRKQAILEEWGGKEGYIQKWREDPRNQGIDATDEEIIKTAEEIHPGVFN
jgi:anaerobic selenocysteine-containing dehydrogenase